MVLLIVDSMDTVGIPKPILHGDCCQKSNAARPQWLIKLRRISLAQNHSKSLFNLLVGTNGVVSSFTKQFRIYNTFWHFDGFLYQSYDLICRHVFPTVGFSANYPILTQSTLYLKILVQHNKTCIINVCFTDFQYQYSKV